MAENFDVVVIGAGPAGYVAAIRAAQLKQKVAIVDKQWLGGVCMNIGCIPSKSLLKNAEVAHTLRERGKDFGFSFDNLKLDYSVAFKRSRQNSDRLTKGVGFLMKKNGVTVYMGSALLTKPNALTVTDKDGKATELSAKNIIIATGNSRAKKLFTGLDGSGIHSRFFTSRIRVGGRPGAAAEPALETDGLTVSYGRTRVIEDLTLAVPRGSVYALLGRNGAGKSSLLRVLLGQRPPAKGRVRLLGEDPWTRRTSLMARVGVVPEEPDAPPEMTACQLSSFCARLQPRWDAAAQAGEVRHA